MTEYRISTVLDPAGAVAGSRQVKQELASLDVKANTSSATLAKAFDSTRLEKSIGTLADRIEALGDRLGKTSKSSTAASAANAELSASLTKVTASAGRASDQLAGVTAASNAQRAGMQQLGYQLGDVATMWSLGAKPAQIFASQIGQITQAVSLMTNGTSKFATFLGGPWGIGLSVGMIALAPFVGKIFEGNDALADSVAKLRDDARETEINAKAKDRFRVSAEGVAAAIRDGTAASREAIEATRTSAEQANIAAKNNLAEELSIRRKTQATLEQSRAALQASLTPGIGGQFAFAGAASGLASGALANVERQLAEQNDLIEQAEKRVQATRVDLAIETAEKQSTAIGRVTLEYDNQIRALERTVRLQVEAGKQVDASLTREIARLHVRKQAAIDNAQAQERLNRAASSAGPLTQFQLPTQGRISSGFGPRRAPTAGASSFHKGVDIAAPTGSRVGAAANGVVIFAGKLGGLGNAIIVDHGGGTITEYGHLSRILVERGQQVGRNAKIGEVGSTGVSTGPHLDFRVKQNGKYVDPMRGSFRTDETAIAARAGNSAATEAQRAAERQQDVIDKRLDVLNQSFIKFTDDAISRFTDKGYGAIPGSALGATQTTMGDAAQFKGGFTGRDVFGRDFGQQGQVDAAQAERNADLERLKQFLNDGTIAYSEQFALREAIEKRHSDRLRQIDEARRDTAIGAASSTAESLLQIAQNSVGQQSAVYKGLFVITKAFAIAESVIKIQQGIANALSLPFPANLAAAATVAAQAASIVSNIQAISLNFADGGLIRGQGGPRADQVPINASPGEYMVNARAVSRPGNLAMLEAINNGQVTAQTRKASNDNTVARIAAAGGAGDSYSLSFGDVVIQAGVGRTAEDSRVIAAETKAQLSKLVDERLAQAKRPGGALTNTRSSVMSGG